MSDAALQAGPGRVGVKGGTFSVVAVTDVATTGLGTRETTRRVNSVAQPIAFDAICTPAGVSIFSGGAVTTGPGHAMPDRGTNSNPACGVTDCFPSRELPGETALAASSRWGGPHEHTKESRVWIRTGRSPGSSPGPEHPTPPNERGSPGVPAPRRCGPPYCRLNVMKPVLVSDPRVNVSTMNSPGPGCAKRPWRKIWPCETRVS